MKNRAKCKLCGSIIESFTVHDYVSCTCGEISIDGGKDYFKAFAKDWTNFLRVDDQDKEIIPKVIDKEEETEPKQEPKESTIDRLTKKDHLQALDEMIEALERLPQQAMTAPVTHYDYYSILILFRAILQAKE